MNRPVFLFTLIAIQFFCIPLQARPDHGHLHSQKDTLKSPANYRIVLNADASESEKWAAGELQHWLYEISGEFLPLHRGDMNAPGARIVIGFSEEVKTKTGASAPAEKDESFHYFSSGKDVFIYGGKQRGTMYGVFAFLENEFGCRWYTPKVAVIPKKRKLVFENYDHKSAPGIRVRDFVYFETFDPTWAARNKRNGRMEYVQQPGGIEAYWAVHTFYLLMPPSEFFAKHPEYFSLINGKRVFEVEKNPRKQLAQLCLSNKDVLKIMTERIKQKIRQNPEYMIYDVSQNDYYNQCECDKCQAIVKKEGAESGLMIWFVNQVAESVEKEFPDKYIGTLAYQYTRTPPKNIKPGKNVVIRLCPIEACVAHDLKSCERNKSFLDDLQTWAAISPQLYIWDYVVNFAHYVMPYPNFAVLQSNIKTFKENKSIGIMEQAAYQSRGGEFSELKAYLISKLLWNSEVNTNEVIDDFMYGYYGRSGKYIREYFNLAQSLITPATHMKIGVQPGDEMFTDEFVNQSLQLFSEALKVADNETIADRVELSALPVYYLKCMRNPAEARNSGLYAKAMSIINKEGVTHLAEAEYLQSLERFKKKIENAK
ncbi:MAG: DUF4838 domain-containing protein [Chitinophagaceae bacterium]|nr:DUF4838 domain-containing protein [Chitinophagaceae bacterium]MCW5926280.1 DUF4838 domain-containing protein [Chitinophagaceae bacterium]